MKHYSPTDYVNWLEEYKVRQKAGLEARKIVASFSKRFFSEHVRICRCSSKLLRGVCVCVWQQLGHWQCGDKEQGLVLDSLSPAAVPPGQVAVLLRALMSSSWKTRIITVASSLSW